MPVTITSVVYRWLYGHIHLCARTLLRFAHCEIDCEVAKEEDGFSTFLTGLALAFALLASVFIFLPYVDTYTSRRFSQNGGDAAAHAGAGRYADDLSIHFPPVPYVELSMAKCPTVPYPRLKDVRDKARKRAVELYKNYYNIYVPGAMGMVRGEASSYANANSEAQLRGFFANVSRRHGEYEFDHRPSRETLYPIYVKADTERNYTLWTERSFDAPAKAAAIAYVTRVRAPVDMPVPHPTMVDPLTGAPCITWMVQYRYDWEITMIKYE